ncbi:hypothetical protein [Dysosmobacter sp.]|uniref:hypothetical protein n=1 Tax=Dysosmobacter sp. TaxID=2591382 RepID=UPI002A85A313|nr:hypothetical protein [Dysosmobacter sp.]MDY3985708.1 hypothetical protein [Dysosmobacter sp.]
MRFPWQVRKRVQMLPNKLDTDKLPWCRDARLVWVDGTGALGWEDRGWMEDDTWGRWYLSCLTLRGTPLLSRKDPGCPTCASLLATGWGPADCPELETVRETLNGGFIHLEDAVPALAPLLGLLEPGLYVIADGDAYPADGGGRFFWDVPDAWTEAPATERGGLSDDDYEWEYPDSAPVFLYPTQRRSRFDSDREAYYEERLQQDGPLPRAVALRVQQGLNLLLDGHHKAAAAARLGRAVPCLTILPLEYYEMKPGKLPRTAVRDKAGFGPFTVPVAELPAKWLPERPGQRPQGRPEWQVGRLADREWPAEYRAAGARYPTAKEYALVTAAEIGYPTDEDLRRWLAEPGRYRRELRSALVLLRGGGDPRLKETALRCAALPDRWCSLKEEAFRVLAAMRGDPNVEQFFIDYFVDLDPYSGHPALTEIANSFWN